MQKWSWIGLVVRLPLMVALSVFATERVAVAQCTPGWQPGQGVPGVYGTVLSMTMWDPDGAGPRSPVLVVGGSFTVAGNVMANCIATWDGESWSPLGSGMTTTVNSPTVEALAVLPTGELVAGGNFFTAGGVQANHIAKWNGSVWSPLGAGADSIVTALAVKSTGPGTGDLFATGWFIGAGGLTVNCIARWNGVAWSSLGSGLGRSGNHPFGFSLLVLPDGDLVVGGTFDSAGGVPAKTIARWNGSTWSAFGTGMNDINAPTVTCLAFLPYGNHDLIAAGSFTIAGGNPANRVARWNGTAWSDMGSGLGIVGTGMRSFAVLLNPEGDNDLVLAGDFWQVSGVTSSYLARWDGLAWSPIGPKTVGPVKAVLAVPNASGGRDLVAGGQFKSIGDVPVNNIAHWDRSTWSSLGPGLNDVVNAVSVTKDGDVVAGGGFTKAGAATASRVARWNGSEWSPLGAGVNDLVRAVHILPGGDVVVGGKFTAAGGTPARAIARWNGATWSPFGAGLVRDVYAVASLPNGDIIAGGEFYRGNRTANRVARWDGATWTQLGTDFDGNFVTALLVLANGDVIAAGDFTLAGGTPANRIARWDGATWLPLGTGFGQGGISAYALVAAPNGDVFVGGGFTSVGGIAAKGVARWNGSSWSAVGMTLLGTVRSLALLPSMHGEGDLIAGGVFSNDGTYGIARWTGTRWAAMGLGMDMYALALAVRPGGELIAGGTFMTADGRVSSYFADYRFDTHAPVISRQPESVTTCRSQAAGLSVVADGALHYQWQRFEIPGDTWLSLTDGPLAGVGTIAGSSTDSLSIDTFGPHAGAVYRCVVSNACGSVTSSTAALMVCAADFDCNGSVERLDYVTFVNAFEAGTAGADFTGDGAIDFFDYDAFVVALESGC